MPKSFLLENGHHVFHPHGEFYVYGRPMVNIFRTEVSRIGNCRLIFASNNKQAISYFYVHNQNLLKEKLGTAMCAWFQYWFFLVFSYS